MHILEYIEACKSSRGIEILLTIETTKRHRHLPQCHTIMYMRESSNVQDCGWLVRLNWQTNQIVLCAKAVYRRDVLAIIFKSRWRVV